MLRLLRAFGLLRVSLSSMDGIVFAKALGCGRGAAFSLLPDWSRYAVILECIDEQSERAVLAAPQFARLRAAAQNVDSWRLFPIKKKGFWDKQSPFEIVADNATGQLAVLTRAKIAPLEIATFIRHSYATTEAIKAAPGLRYSIGMGEWPLIWQATFTIWESEAEMAEYAYKNVGHIAAIKAKVKTGMFTEEMFVRFGIARMQIT